MNFQLRRLLKDIATYGIGDILLKATAFFTMPIYTRLFTPADYGVWSYIVTVLGLLSAFLILGCDSAYALYFFRAKDETEQVRITSTVFSFLFAWSVSLIAIALPFTATFSAWSFNTPQHSLLFALALLTAPLTVLNSICGQVLRNQFQARRFTQLNVIATICTILFSLLGAIVFKLGIMGLFLGTLLGAAIMLPVRLWMVRPMLRPTFSWPILKQLLAYGLPLTPVGLAYWIFASSDRLVLGKLSTLEQLGLYAVANSVTNLLAFVHGAIGQAWSPHAIRLREGQPEVAAIVFGQMMTYILVIFGLLCVGFTTFAHELLMIFASPIFYGAAPVFGPLALGFVAYATTHITALGISLSGKTVYLMIFSWIAALFNLGVNVLWVPSWGMMAAGWTTALAYIILTLAYLVTSQRLMPVAYETRRLITGTILIFAFTLAAPLIPATHLIVGLILKSVYCLLFIVLVFVFQVLGQREWTTVRNLWRSVPIPLMRRIA